MQKTDGLRSSYRAKPTPLLLEVKAQYVPMSSKSGIFASIGNASFGVVAQVVSTLAGTNPLSPLPGKALVETGSFLGTSTSIFPMSVDEEM